MMYRMRKIKIHFHRYWWREKWQEFSDFLELTFHSNLPRLALLLFLVLFVSGALMLLLESNNPSYVNIIDSIWWAIVSMTTTGYGDKVPVTLWGRILGGAVMLSGVVIISFFTATVSSIFVSKKLREERGLQKIFYKDHYVILGWNESGFDLVETLLSQSEEGSTLKIALLNQLAPEKVEELQQRFKSDRIKYLNGDYTGTAALKRAQVEQAKAVMVLIDTSQSGEVSDERAVLATLAVKSLNPRIRIYVHALQRQNEGHLRRAGADRVIVSDKYTGYLLATCAAAPSIPKVLDYILGQRAGSKLKSIKLPAEFIGKTFEEISKFLKTKENAILMGFVTGESILCVDDILSHDISSVDDFIQRKFRQAGLSPEELETTQINLNPPLDYKMRENDLAVIIGGK
jgi:voltage-gated potassium channel